MLKRNQSLNLAAIALSLCVVVASGSVNAGESPGDNKSLFNRLGGLMPISVVVSDFIDELIPDAEMNKNPAIAEARERVPAPYLKYHVTAMVCQATGGPCEYKGRDMVSSHAHLNITEAEWQRMLVIFKEVLAAHKVPNRETRELLDIVGSTKADIVSADKT